MSRWKAMYVKELKELRLAAAIALVLTVAVDLYVLSSARSGPSVSPTVALLLLPYLGAIVLPVVLAQSLTAEWKGTHYQMLSLPVSRTAVLLTKAEAVYTLAAALFLAHTAIVHLTFAIEVDQARQGSGSFTTGVDGGDIWSLFASAYWGILLLLGGLAAVAATARLAARRLKRMAAAGVTLGGLYLYGKLHGLVVPVLAEALGRPAAFTGFGPTGAVASGPVQFVYAALLGAAFLAVAALLFERAVEA